MKWRLMVLVYAWSLSAATIGISPATTNVAAGTPFTVDLTITSVLDLFAFQVDLGFTPGILSASLVTDGGFLNPSVFIPGTIDNAAGTISFITSTLTGPPPGVSGSGTLATIHFLAIAEGTSTIAPANALLLDSSLTDIAATLVNGTVNVGGANAVPEPGTGILLWTAAGLVLGGALLRRRAERQQRRRAEARR